MIGCHDMSLRNSKKCIRCVREKVKPNYPTLQDAYNSGTTGVNPGPCGAF